MASGGSPLLQNSSSEIEKKAILNMEGNDECADCGQTSKSLRKLVIRGFIPSFPCVRSGMGLHQPWLCSVHRVLWHPPQDGRTCFKNTLSYSG